MKRESFQQFAIVAADSAQELTERLNAELFKLRDKRPQVTFEGMIARISYTEEIQIAETVSDDFEERHLADLPGLPVLRSGYEIRRYAGRKSEMGRVSS